MTVTTGNIVSGPYLGNGLSNQFSYTFGITDASELTVFETDGNGVETELTLNTDYTVAGVGAETGRLVTRTAGNLPSGYTWYIRANYSFSQETSFESQGAFSATIHESAFDKLTYLIKQVNDSIGRGLKLSDSDTNPGDLIIPTDRANKVLGFDATGLPITSVDVSELSGYASSASTSETNAAASATAASTSETNAANSATAASTSETNAAASATAAANSATNAATSASTAQSVQTQVENLFDQFGDQYLGSKSSDPSVDNDGDPLNEGDFYWNSVSNELRFYNGSSFVAPETVATTAASNASTSETNAAASATAASTSETNAAASATAASTSETNAAASATAAASSAASVNVTNKPFVISSGINLFINEFDASSQVSTGTTNTHGIYFKSDGTKMYLGDYNNQNIYQYSLSTAWDVTTATYDSVSYNAAVQPVDIFIRNDGLKIYVISEFQDRIFQYSMSTAWDLSTMSYDSKLYSMSAQDTSPSDVYFKSDGTKMYMCGNSTSSIYEYNLSTAWDVTTATFGSVNIDISTETNDPQSINISSDGKILIIADRTKIYKYLMSTAWSLQTLKFESESLLAELDNPIWSIFTESDGYRIFSFSADATKGVVSMFNSSISIANK